MRKREVFRKTEHCLYHYRLNTARLEVVRSELEKLRQAGDVHAQDYSGRMNAGACNADPISSYVHKLLSLEHRISVLERYTQPITRLITDLQHSPEKMSRNYLLVLEYFYFSGLTVPRILEIIHWSRSTFFSRRLSLVILASDYIFVKTNK